jgi:ABC-type multidrug transport system ATPase subunit
MVLPDGGSGVFNPQSAIRPPGVPPGYGQPSPHPMAAGMPPQGMPPGMQPHQSMPMQPMMPQASQPGMMPHASQPMQPQMMQPHGSQPMQPAMPNASMPMQPQVPANPSASMQAPMNPNASINKPKLSARTMAISDFQAQSLVPATSAEVTLGRQPANNIVFEAPDVSGWHAKIRRGPTGGLIVEDLGSTNGTYVNGERITQKPITFKDDVRLGSMGVQLSDPRISGLLLRINRRPERGTPIMLGSGTQCDVVINDVSVAPQHASITESPDGLLLLRDMNAPSGTYVDSPNFRIHEAKIHGAQTVLLGQFILPMPVLGRALEEADPSGLARSMHLSESLAQALQGDRQVLTIGREPGNDLVIPHPTISSRHARFTRLQDGTLGVEDVGSTNGTFINGQRISRGVAKPGDVVSVGAISFTIGVGGRIEGAGRASVRLDLVQLGLVVKDRGSGQPRALLDSVSFSIYPKELVAMLGPSGAGKTTLLMTVLGITRPTSGGVLLNGRPLFQQYDSFRTNVGYVPQDDIVHPELTVREALFYACKLRLPAGTSRKSMDVAIEQTLKQVGLWEQRNLQIGSAQEKVLSGGQRRRVNLAVELVTDPALLILDEPTSGLSWTDAADVVATLRRLANDGRTIVLTIHQPDFQEYEKFDSVAIMGRGGKLLFFGPPDPDSYTFFGAERGRPREMFDHVEQMPPDQWRERFHQTETYRRFVLERGPKQGAQAQAPPPKPRSRSSFSQFPVLLGRTFRLTFRSRAALVILLLQAPLLGLLIGITVGSEGTYRAQMFGCVDSPDTETYGDWCNVDAQAPIACDPQRSMMGAQQMQAGAIAAPIPDMNARMPDPRIGLIAILMALFLPMVIASSNALVGERTIYERERLAGLNIFPYVGARFTVLFVLGAVVALLNMAVSVPMLGLEGGFHYYVLVGIMTTSAASAIGLALSAAVKRPVSALWGINLLVIPQLLFAGGIVRLENFTYWTSWLTVTRYGLEALVNVDLRAREGIQECQVQRYLHNYAGFPTDLDYPLLFAAIGTGAITFLSIALTMILLKLKDK